MKLINIIFIIVIALSNFTFRVGTSENIELMNKQKDKIKNFQNQKYKKNNVSSSIKKFSFKDGYIQEKELEAEKNFKSGNIYKTVEILTELFELNPQIEYKLQRGIAYYLLREPLKALKDLDEVTYNDPTNYLAYQYMGLTFLFLVKTPEQYADSDEFYFNKINFAIHNFSLSIKFNEGKDTKNLSRSYFYRGVAKHFALEKYPNYIDDFYASCGVSKEEFETLFAKYQEFFNKEILKRDN